MQQLQVRNEGTPPEDQDRDQSRHSFQDQEGQQVQDVDEADIIQFTYSTKCVARPEPGAAGPEQDIYLVSSETEDSEDYSKDPDSRTVMTQSKPRRGRRTGSGLRCRVCSQTFKARRVLLRHVRAHLQEADLVCGLCGQHFDTAESLKLHLQTHQTGRRAKTRTREGQQQSEPDRRSCDDCGKKTGHRCLRRRTRPGHPDRPTRRTRTLTDRPASARLQNQDRPPSARLQDRPVSARS